MDTYELMYSGAINEIQAQMDEELREYSVDNLTIIESDLDGWDYCFSIVFGLLGVVLSTNEKIGAYFEEIHKVASGVSGDFDPFQEIMGQLLHHSGDNIDQIDGRFINRNGDNAWGLFHRLLWGHDMLDFSKDNPFYLMFNQKGMMGILQALRHLIADTMSRQGLPMPGSSYLDRTFEKGGNQKTSNYLIDIAKRLSDEAGGNVEAEKVYSHLFTMRAQDFAGTLTVKVLSDVYLKSRKICDEIRATQFKLICYSVNFFGEAIYGAIKQGGIPFINKSLGLLTGKEFINLYLISNRETTALCKKSDRLIDETDRLVQSVSTKSELLKIDNANNCIAELKKGEKNIEELIDFFEEEQ